MLAGTKVIDMKEENVVIDTVSEVKEKKESIKEKSERKNKKRKQFYDLML